MATGDEREIGVIHAETGEVLMLNKKERKLVKELLDRTFSSEAAKQLIKKKFGEEYIEIGYRLIEILTGNEL